MHFDQDAILTYLNDALGLASVRSIEPFIGNTKTLSNKIQAKKVAFFGQLRINPTVAAFKSPSAIDSITFGGLTDLYTKLNGDIQELLYTPTLTTSLPAPIAAQHGDGPMVFDNILFDDLVWLKNGYLSTSNLGDIPGIGIPLVPGEVSMSRLVKGGTVSSSSLFVVPSNTYFNYAPALLQFCGYLVIIS